MSLVLFSISSTRRTADQPSKKKRLHEFPVEGQEQEQEQGQEQEQYFLRFLTRMPGSHIHGPGTVCETKSAQKQGDTEFNREMELKNKKPTRRTQAQLRSS